MLFVPVGCSVCIPGTVPLDVLCVLADGGSHVFEGCSSGPGPTVSLSVAKHGSLVYVHSRRLASGNRGDSAD
eukprot:2860211-Pyramimonas_sp.AAC.1